MPRIEEPLIPFWRTKDKSTVRLFLGDVLTVLRRLPSKSVQCVVTSPPYWGLRDYKTGSLNEIGTERTPEEYVAKMVEVFREVRRVLRDDGVFFLNLGDSYTGSSQTAGLGSLDGQERRAARMFQRGGGQGYTGNLGAAQRGNEQGLGPAVRNLPSGNLVGVPWRVALALQADGWVLRQDIIWAKPSPMPESVKNRCTKAHEYVFLLTKSKRYFCDMEAIKERSREDDTSGPAVGGTTYQTDPGCGKQSGNGYVSTGRSNRRSVWTVSSQGYPGAHFATFPPKLIEPMILAGTSEKGACVTCGAPWRRIVEERKLTRPRPNDYVKRTGEDGTGLSCANTVAGVDSVTLGWSPSCSCYGVDTIECPPNCPIKRKKETDDEFNDRVVKPLYADLGTRPCIVLDPFIGRYCGRGLDRQR